MPNVLLEHVYKKMVILWQCLKLKNKNENKTNFFILKEHCSHL